MQFEEVSDNTKLTKDAPFAYTDSNVSLPDINSPTTAKLPHGKVGHIRILSGRDDTLPFNRSQIKLT